MNESVENAYTYLRQRATDKDLIEAISVLYQEAREAGKMKLLIDDMNEKYSVRLREEENLSIKMLEMRSVIQALLDDPHQKDSQEWAKFTCRAGLGVYEDFHYRLITARILRDVVMDIINIFEKNKKMSPARCMEMVTRHYEQQVDALLDDYSEAIMIYNPPGDE